MCGRSKSPLKNASQWLKVDDSDYNSKVFLSPSLPIFEELDKES